MQRMHVIRLTIEGREFVERGAKFLAISVRQMKRLRRKMREEGVEWLLHANRGKASWNKTASEKIKQVLQFARGRYSGLNDTYLTEKVKENEKIALSRPTVRTILHQGDRGGEKARGQTSLQEARTKSSEGDLLFWDGRPHCWFADQLGEWNLMMVVDDVHPPMSLTVADAVSDTREAVPPHFL